MFKVKKRLSGRHRRNNNGSLSSSHNSRQQASRSAASTGSSRASSAEYASDGETLSSASSVAAIPKKGCLKKERKKKQLQQPLKTNNGSVASDNASSAAGGGGGFGCGSASASSAASSTNTSNNSHDNHSSCCGDSCGFGAMSEPSSASGSSNSARGGAVSITSFDVNHTAKVYFDGSSSQIITPDLKENKQQYQDDQAPASVCSSREHDNSTISTFTRVNTKTENEKVTDGGVSSGNKGVRFMHVQIREFERIIGDNPSCSSGAPIGIGWGHSVKDKIFSLKEYESSRPKRRSQSDLVLTRQQREELLVEWGANFSEIVDAIRANIRVKNQRRRTVNAIGTYDRWEEVMESAGRKLKRTLTFRGVSGGGAGPYHHFQPAPPPSHHHRYATHLVVTTTTRQSAPAPAPPQARVFRVPHGQSYQQHVRTQRLQHHLHRQQQQHHHHHQQHHHQQQQQQQHRQHASTTTAPSARTDVRHSPSDGEEKDQNGDSVASETSGRAQPSSVAPTDPQQTQKRGESADTTGSNSRAAIMTNGPNPPKKPHRRGSNSGNDITDDGRVASVLAKGSKDGPNAEFNTITTSEEEKGSSPYFHPTQISNISTPPLPDAIIVLQQQPDQLSPASYQGHNSQHFQDFGMAPNFCYERQPHQQQQQQQPYEDYYYLVPQGQQPHLQDEYFTPCGHYPEHDHFDDGFVYQQGLPTPYFRPPPQYVGNPDGGFDTLTRDGSFWELRAGEGEPGITREAAPMVISEDFGGGPAGDYYNEQQQAYYPSLAMAATAAAAMSVASSCRSEQSWERNAFTIQPPPHSNSMIQKWE